MTWGAPLDRDADEDSGDFHRVRDLLEQLAALAPQQA
jgi:hypothetical protein